jgi:hypothetical protein
MRLWPAIFLAVALNAGGAQDLEPASSAELCGRCHRAILEAWKSSAHAKAMESTLFQQGLQQAEAELKGEAQTACLGCHAPLALLSRDTTLRLKATWEGVTCNYCHSMRDVSLAGGNPVAAIELSTVKRGPLKGASAPAHGTLFSPVHTSSLACAPCHEYKNSLGFPVLTTYSEWAASRFAKEERTCQSCHMYQVAGDVVDPKVLKAGGAKVNLHQMPGSRSLEQLNKTVKANLAVTREKDRLRVVIEVASREAGHYVPTGSPLRQLVLELTVDSYDGRRFREERVYRRAVADKAGNPPGTEHDAFRSAAKVVSDTRLAPDEKRTEEFSIPVAAGVSAQVKASFSYLFSPSPRTGARERITFLTIDRFVR